VRPQWLANIEKNEKAAADEFTINNNQQRGFIKGAAG